MDLRGAQLQWANELSSKKNVFKVALDKKFGFKLLEEWSNIKTCQTADSMCATWCSNA